MSITQSLPHSICNWSFRKMDCTNWDFSGRDIRGCDFSHANLEGANFSHVIAGRSEKQNFRDGMKLAISIVTLVAVSLAITALPSLPCEGGSPYNHKCLWKVLLKLLYVYLIPIICVFFSAFICGLSSPFVGTGTIAASFMIVSVEAIIATIVSFPHGLIQGEYLDGLETQRMYLSLLSALLLVCTAFTIRQSWQAFKVLTGTNFQGAILRHVDFSGAILNNCSFSEADIDYLIQAGFSIYPKRPRR